MLNWVLTGDTYTTLDEWAHDSERINEFWEEEEEDPINLHDLFNETGYQGSSKLHDQSSEGENEN